MPDTISDGEAQDFRLRLGAMERRAADVESRINVHEQKCASRYQQILFLLGVSIALNIPTAWPHLLTMIGWVK